MDCRSDCGACCIAPSISSPIPGMPLGKPANTRCVHLDDNMRCGIFTRHCALRYVPACKQCGKCVITPVKRRWCI